VREGYFGHGEVLYNIGEDGKVREGYFDHGEVLFNLELIK